MIRFFFDYLFFTIYRWVFLPFALLILKSIDLLLPSSGNLAMRSWKKMHEMLLERKVPVYMNLSSQPILIHAASGEIEYAKPVIRAIKQRYPQATIMVTYFSPSAKKLFKDIEGVDLFIPLPWDHRRYVQSFLNFYRPKMILYARTDVWPEFSYQARQRKIPQLLFASTFAANSSRLRGLGLFLTRWSLHQLNDIFCVDDADAIQLKIAQVMTTCLTEGDTRFDQVFHRLQRNKLSLTSLEYMSNRTLVLGSTWPPDEDVILKSISSALQKFPWVIWAPHEVHETHLLDLEQRLAQQQVTVTRWSRRDLSIPPSIPYGVLLIDQVGVLADLYRLGAVAFVGGSFKDKVHSVMEPLACGCFVVTGPKINNNREALLFKNISVENLTAVTVVNNSDEFTMALNKIHNDLTSNDTKNSNLVNTQPNTNQDKHVIKYDLKKKLQEKVQSKQGASSKVLAWIERNQNLS